MSEHEQPRPHLPDHETGSEEATDAPAVEDWSDCPIDLEIDYDARVNFAMQQNDVPVLKRLRLVNRSGEEIVDLKVGIRIAGDFSELSLLRIDRLAPGGEFLLERLDLDLDPRALAARREREKTRLEMTIESGNRRTMRHRPIEILAFNEWGGVSSLPEIIAAFIQPNHPAIDGILAQARKIEGERSGATGLQGYQSGSTERAIAEIAAIYAAVRGLEIAYVGVPASFEDEGQKVRLADSVLENRLGNCLDLSLLIASAFEQAGFNPLIVLVKGHAFVGAWTTETSFAEPALDDAARLRKRVDLGDVVVIEATSVTQGAGFEQAAAEARRRLDDDAQFGMAIDVACARRLKIRPLPARSDGRGREDELRSTLVMDLAGTRDLDATAVIRSDELEAPPVTGDEPEVDVPPGPTPRRETRLDRWKRRLLDLSLRNRLLNFRPTRKTLALAVPDPAALEDRLAEGGEFGILPRAPLADDASPRDLAAMSERTREDALRSFHREEMLAGRLHAPVTPEDLERRLVEIHRAARTDLEETGSNTLHLALGFLSWFETENGDQERRAPLLMLPVELTRRSARAEFRLRLAEDEPRINVTLLEKLRRDHDIEVAGLDELPTDESGLDITALFRRFREAIVDMPRWDLVEDAALGLFSFNKFLMWQDLEVHAGTLRESPVVRHLIDEPGAPFEAEAEYPESTELDRIWPAADAFCPLDADSSQLAAVLAATSGRSFVLQGPPGTGKSQTITNLIAQALAAGKRVLFVAEKMAALNVVHSRLARVGLDGACLEIHSNKSSKRHVLEQLRVAIEAPTPAAPTDWDRTAADLDRHRRELNAYVEAVHERHPPGISIFEATARLLAMKETPRVELGIAKPEEVELEGWRALRESAERLGVAAAELGPPGEHALNGIERGDWTPQLEAEIEGSLRALDQAAAEWRESLAACRELLGLEGGGEELGRAEIEALAEAARLLLGAPGVETRLLTDPGFKEIEGRLRESIARGIERDRLRGELRSRFDDALVEGDPGPHIDALRRARASFPPLSFFRGLIARRAVKPYVLGAVPDTDTLIAGLERIRKLREEETALALPGGDEARYFGRAWRAGRGDWKELAARLDWAGRFRGRLAALGSSGTAPLRDRLLALATERRDLAAEGGPRRRDLERLAGAGRELEERILGFRELTRFAEDAGPDAHEPALLAALATLASRIRAGLRDLRPWCHWARLRAEGSRSGLDDLIRELEQGRIEPASALRVFERSFLEVWLDRRLAASKLLLRFNSREHERLIENFRDLDRKQMDLARRVLEARIGARAPALDRQVSARSEVGILQRQLKLKRRHLPIRRLFESLPELLPRLKPCLLMSPLSVAQYLGPDFPRADLVIFDEASQIPVWDAIGALARGRAAVVVGDSRQLPPTTFFDRQTDDDEPDEELVEELESILDECEAGGLRSLRLLWHYRSRHEGLIAFSNHHYYDGRLQTFPAPLGADGARGVSLEFVGGVYDRSGTATNELEARAIVDELARRLEAPEESKSIGVVAFSKAQQDLIMDLLDQRRREHPALETYFVEDSEDRVFVKNLENVQGDERDIILFSICYGPDAAEKVTMNFGPLNREGGERRLNVAITRARRELVVFSSIRPEQIDLARSQALGVAHLKSFLEYAERGPRALGDQAATRPDPGRGRQLEAALATALEERGHVVDRDLGSSSFRIDVAVRDPRDPERHVLGIACDGACYRDAATARDRDRIRESVLAALGWTLMRVWSQDWYQDSAREIERIEARIASLLAADPTEAAVAVAASEEAPDHPVESEAEVGPVAEPELRTEVAAESGERPENDPELLQAAPSPTRLDYVETPLDAETVDLDRDEGLAVADGMVLAIVAAEWPVHADAVLRRVARAAGVDRITHKVKRLLGERFDALASEKRLSVDGDFLFAAGKSADDVRVYRPAPARGSPRDPEQIHPAEIALAAADVITTQIALPADELLRETSRLLGYSRTSARMLRYLQAGVDLLVERGGCIVDDDNVRLPRDEEPK